MNLTGTWKGKYTYGTGYPAQTVGKSEPFEIDIVDYQGALTGNCIDDVVQSMEGNESYIIGTFKENEITFKKRYKFHPVLDESGFSVLDDKVKFDGVDYKGRLRKKLFSAEQFFTGEWRIISKYKDENNLLQTFTFRGSWSMRKTR